MKSITALCALTLATSSLSLPILADTDDLNTDLASRNSQNSFIDHPRSLVEEGELAERDPLFLGLGAKVAWKLGSRVLSAFSSRRKRELDSADDYDELVSKDLSSNTDAIFIAARRFDDLQQREPILPMLAVEAATVVGPKLWNAWQNRKAKKGKPKGKRDFVDYDSSDLQEREFLGDLMDEIELRASNFDQDWETVLGRDGLEEMD